MSPTRRAAVTLGLLAVAAVVLQGAWWVAAVLAVALAGFAFADAIAVRRRRAHLTRSQLPTVARGVPVPFEESVVVGGRGPVALRQPFPPELSVVPSEVRGAESVLLESEVTGRHRGIHALPRAAVRKVGPLGLASSDVAVGSPQQVVVMPDLPRARRMAEARARGRLGEEGRIRSRLGIGTEFETVRDYTPDDDVRQINWIASSRVGRPMSNQYRIDENRDLICLVDVGRLMAAPLRSGTRLDIALDAVAALAVAAEEAGDRVGTIAFGETILRKLTPRRRGAEAVVRALFDLEPEEVESDYGRAFTAVGGAKRALVALFTDLMDESATSSLIEALPVLVRSHAVMAVTCSDIDLVAAANKPPERVYDVLRQAVAVDLLDSTARSVSLLRAMGALVVVGSPDRLGSACVDGYLRLKRRARV